MTHPDPETVLWRRFRDGYSQPFQDHSAPPGADYMLDLIAGAAFDTTGNGSLRPVNKADVFGEFMWPLDPEAFLAGVGAFPAAVTTGSRQRSGVVLGWMSPGLVAGAGSPAFSRRSSPRVPMMETREVMERWQSWVFIWIAAPFVGATLGIILCDIFAL